MIKPIQSLRAFAVAIVLLFHLGIGYFERGYLGVDIFFTVSGFVIYLSYINKIDSIKDIIAFLKSRFLRLFPAYLSTSIIITSFASTLLLPEDIKSTLIDGALSIFGIVNFYYLFTTNYFSIDADYRPFLHFWSLAVEQQYYIIFSIYVLALLNFGKIPSITKAILKKINITAMLAMFFVSLSLSVFLRDMYAPADFFNPATRSWQFIAGMVAAEMVIARRKKIPENVWNPNITKIGFYALLAVVFYSTLVGFHENLIFDQFIIAVCIAMLCYVSATSIPETLIDNESVQWIGKISYSLYLVHWPVIVFYRFLTNRDFSPTELAGLIVVTLALSAALHYLVEVPWKRWPAGVLRARTTGFVAATVAAGLLGFVTTKLAFAETDYAVRVAARQAAGTRANIDDYCVRRQTEFNHGIICDIKVGANAPTLTIMGDSHLVPLIPSLGRQKDYNITAYIATGCLPLRAVAYKIREQRVLCDRFFDSAFDAQPAGRTVVLVARWNGYSDLAESKQAIVNALSQTVDAFPGKIQLVQQPFEFAQLLPFALAYARGPDMVRSIKPRPGYFPDGAPHLSKNTPRKPHIIETRNTLCALSGKRHDTANACLYSSKLGLFYADDNHLLPNIAANLKIVP